MLDLFFLGFSFAFLGIHAREKNANHTLCSVASPHYVRLANILLQQSKSIFGTFFSDSRSLYMWGFKARCLLPIYWRALATICIANRVTRRATFWDRLWRKQDQNGHVLTAFQMEYSLVSTSMPIFVHSFDFNDNNPVDISIRIYTHECM